MRRNWSRLRRPTSGLAALAAAVVVLGGAPLWAQDGTSEPEASPEPASSAADRATPAPVRSAVPVFALHGVVVVDGQIRMALLSEATLTGGRAIMLRQGDRLGAYRLTGGSHDRVVLEGGGKQLVVPLASPPGPVAASAPAPAPAPTPAPAAKPAGSTFTPRPIIPGSGTPQGDAAKTFMDALRGGRPVQ